MSISIVLNKAQTDGGTDTHFVCVQIKMAWGSPEIDTVCYGVPIDITRLNQFLLAKLGK